VNSSRTLGNVSDGEQKTDDFKRSSLDTVLVRFYDHGRNLEQHQVFGESESERQKALCLK